MLYVVDFKCSDNFGSWRSNSAFFANNDIEAKNQAKKEIVRLGERWKDIQFSDISLLEHNPNGKDRFISNIS